MNRRHAIEKLAMTFVAAVSTLTSGRIRAESQEPVYHTVEIKGFTYEPPTIVVKRGDRVTWVNWDFVPHTASAVDESWDTGELKADESVEIVVTDNTGESYFCRHHPSMKGKLLVE